LRRHYLSKKEKKALLNTLREKYNTHFEADKIEVVYLEDEKIYVFDGHPAFMEKNNKLLPLLTWLLEKGHCFLPKIVVDKGAIKPIGSGADVMAPGIVRLEGDFKEKTIVVVVEEKGIPIAVVETLYDKETIENLSKGKVAVNIHWPGDRIWKKVKNI